MADKQISDLTSASSLTDGSLFVLEQGGAAKKANWGMMKNYLSPGVAAQYSSSSTYKVGDYVIYNGQLYCCTTAITTAESWTAAHWTLALLGNDVSDLKNATNAIAKSEDLSWLAKEYDGKCLNSSNAEIAHSLMAHTDYILIPQNAVAVKCGNLTSNAQGTTTYHISPNVLFYDNNKAFINAVNNISDNIAVYPIADNAKYIRVNQPSTTVPVKEALIQFILNDVDGFVGKSTVAFTSTATAKHTLLKLTAKKAYTIICKTAIAGRINFFIQNDTSAFVSVFQKESVEFIPKSSGWLMAYNDGGTVTGNVDFEVYESSMLLAKMRRQANIYEVGADKTYTSLTALLLELKDDDSEKTIYVDGGDYDIFQEYTDLGLLSGDPPSNPINGYYDYNVWIPENTHIIGRGIVRLLWKPESTDISTAWSKTISPVNVAGSMTLENVEIHCKNGRYCIHDDPLGKRQFWGAIKKYINVKCYRHQNDSGYGMSSVIGFGLDYRMSYRFDNCLFKNEENGNAFYMHSRACDPTPTADESPTVTVNNCIMDTSTRGVVLGVVVGTSDMRIRTEFNSCHIGGQVIVSDEGDITSGTRANCFDLTFLNCDDPTINIVSETNPYTPVVYN